MHLVTLRMERLYDVHKDPFSNNLTRTLFSFDSNGRKYLSISVEGSPHLESGQTITAALQQADNWQTVRGMLIHETGELCVRSVSLYIGSILLTAFLASICFMQLRFSYPQLVMPCMVAFGLVAATFAHGAYKTKQLTNALLSTRSTSGA